MAIGDGPRFEITIGIEIGRRAGSNRTIPIAVSIGRGRPGLGDTHQKMNYLRVFHTLVGIPILPSDRRHGWLQACARTVRKARFPLVHTFILYTGAAML